MPKAYHHQDDLRQAEELAGKIGVLCEGFPTVSVYMALSMVLGQSEAAAPRPDMDNFMRLIDQAARHYFEHARLGQL